MSPALKLTYFDLAGRAELARLVFTYGGVAFEDVRVSIPEFRAMKASLPLGQLPTLEVNGVVFSQAQAINRYAAKVAGLYPTDIVQALCVEMISETLLELAVAVADIVWFTTDEAAKAEKTTKVVNETFPKSFTTLEAMVQGKFFMGDNATLADVHLLDIAHNNLKAFIPEFDMSKYPKLEGVIEAVKSNTSIAAHVAKL